MNTPVQEKPRPLLSFSGWLTIATFGMVFVLIYLFYSKLGWIIAVPLVVPVLMTVMQMLHTEETARRSERSRRENPKSASDALPSPAQRSGSSSPALDSIITHDTNGNEAKWELHYSEVDTNPICPKDNIAMELVNAIFGSMSFQYRCPLCHGVYLWRDDRHAQHLNFVVEMFNKRLREAGETPRVRRFDSGE